MQVLVTAQLKISGTDLTAALTPATISITPAATAIVADTQTIATTVTTVTVGSIGTAGYAAFENSDPTNFVVLSLVSDGSTPFAKLLPGQIAVLPLATKVIYAKADTAPVALNVLIASA